MATIKNKIIKNFFDKKELLFLQKYCHNKLDLKDAFRMDERIFSPAWYYDPVMNSFLDLKLSKVEAACKLKLFPTYAYWRYYVLGGSLYKHRDRPSCEISITACVKKYDDWPMIIEGKEFELQEGDALLYAGCVQEHWRPGTYEGEGMAQVFFHYVDKNGPFTHHAYDKFYRNTELIESEKDKRIIDEQISGNKKVDKEYKNPI